MTHEPRGPSHSRLVLDCVGSAGDDLETLTVHEDSYEGGEIIAFSPEGYPGNGTRWLSHDAARALYDWLGATLRRNTKPREEPKS